MDISYRDIRCWQSEKYAFMSYLGIVKYDNIKNKIKRLEMCLFWSIYSNVSYFVYVLFISTYVIME